jgi:hypothetical protein
MLSELVVQPNQGRSAIVSMDRSGKWCFHMQFPVSHNPSHTIRVLDDGTCLYLNSSHGRLVHFDLDGSILSSEKITDKFLRGLFILPNRQLIIGAGNTLLYYDLNSHRTFAEIELSSDPLNSVFDIQILPADFDLPPTSLSEKVGRIIGFDGKNVIWENSISANSDPHS